MKMFYGKTPIKSLNIKHFEMSTNDCTMVASDLQAGVTAVARGQKITGTGKAFEFASYGGFITNFPISISNPVNIVEIASTQYPVKLNVALSNMKTTDFTKPVVLGTIVIDSVEYPISTNVNNGILTLACDKTLTLQVFYGKDNYV